MTRQELFIAANRAVRTSIDQIKEGQWTLEMPPGTSTKPSTLREAVRYHIFDDAWVPEALAGKTIDEVGDAYDYLRDEESLPILATFDDYNQRASDVVSNFTDLTSIVHLSYGDYSADEYLLHIIIFRAFRSYDIAKLIGVSTRMDTPLVQALWDTLTPVVEQFRQIGVFPPALAVGENASPQEKLLALVGRK